MSECIHGVPLYMSCPDCHEVPSCPNPDDEIVRLTARVAELEEGLKPFEEYATYRVVDAPQWSDSGTVSIIVSIKDLRRARALLSKGGDHAG